jgi:hypothetical protein
MEDIPQPPNQPYERGDLVEVQMPEDDNDAVFNGWVCEVIDILEDDLEELTERETDNLSYKLRPVDEDEPLPMWVRHFDIVPASDSTERS